MTEVAMDPATREALLTLAANREHLRYLLESDSEAAFPRSATVRWLLALLWMSRSPVREALRGPLAMLLFGLFKRLAGRMTRSRSRALRAPP